MKAAKRILRYITIAATLTFSTSSVLAIVIGKDELVSTSTQCDANADRVRDIPVGQLVGEMNGGEEITSAALVMQNNIVITSAHMLVQDKALAKYDRLYFRIDVKGAQGCGPREFEIERRQIYGYNFEDGSIDLDYAVITLVEPVPDYRPFSVMPQSIHPSVVARAYDGELPIYVAGFPAHKSAGFQKFLSVTEGRLHRVPLRGHMLSDLMGKVGIYDADTYGGMSGGPVFIELEGNDPKQPDRFLIGVHTRHFRGNRKEVDGCEAFLLEECFNSGIMMQPSMRKAIEDAAKRSPLP